MFWSLLWVFAGISLLAVGGANAVLPEMHRILVTERGWLDDATFSQLYALAQAAPGPNVLATSLFGWRVGGVSGLVAATLGMLVPAAALAWVVGGLVQRLSGKPWLGWVRGGLVPVAVGLIFAAGLTMAMASSEGGGWAWVALTAASTLFVWRTEWSPLWVLAAGGMVGWAVG